MGVEITVTHLTRMGGGRICVAGITDDGEFVRPDCAGYLHRYDVPSLFEIGARVDLGIVNRVPAAPQLENVTFRRNVARRVGTASTLGLRKLLGASAVGRVNDVFGDALAQTHTGSICVAPGKGTASLGTITVDASTFELRTDDFAKLRGYWPDPDRGTLQPAVTDLRLYPNGATLDDDALTELIDECEDCEELFLSVGLTKNWPQNPGHWLQLNSILPFRRPEPVRVPKARASGWPRHRPEQLASLRASHPDVMASYPRAWAPWNDAEDQALIDAFERGEQSAVLAERHERKRGAIRSRLRKLGLVE
jgi:hypothetical protein